MKNNIINKIEKAGLIGRGGAGYPTAKKWREVKKVTNKEKYVICNASEGEMGLFKDLYILRNYPERVVEGIVLALDYINSKNAFFNINKKYHRQVKEKLTKIIKKYGKKGYEIKFFIEEPSYVGGEETALLNAIEEKRTEPRIKPPYPSSVGLFGKPTLINNVETFYNVSCVNNDTFTDKRFYSISGNIKNPGVHHMPDNWSIEKILKETENYPNFDFFVQIGGSASGLILNQGQLKKQKMTGAGGLEIYNKKTDAKKILLRWFKFYQEESCGKCTPCRMGSFQLYDMTKNSRNIPWGKIFEILKVMDETSFCALGQSLSGPVHSYYVNIFRKK